MPVGRKLMLLCDSFSINNEVVIYATGLARRLDEGLLILVIISSRMGKEADRDGVYGGTIEEDGEETLETIKKRIEESGVAVEILVKRGDPVSEFLKFMAEESSFDSIIWGGKEEIIRERSKASREHWVNKVKGMVDCSWVAPF